MYTPDRNIVKKIKEYDRYLYVKWNSEKEYFEVWREMTIGRELITPVTQSIYDTKAPISFAPLDERILWWLVNADSHRYGGSKQMARFRHKEWVRMFGASDTARRKDFYDRAKDCYSLATNFYTTKHATKNKKFPSFNTKKPVNKWIRPDVRNANSRYVYKRSRANARAYGFKKT